MTEHVRGLRVLALVVGTAAIMTTSFGLSHELLPRHGQASRTDAAVSTGGSTTKVATSAGGAATA